MIKGFFKVLYVFLIALPLIIISLVIAFVRYIVSFTIAMQNDFYIFIVKQFDLLFNDSPDKEQ